MAASRGRRTRVVLETVNRIRLDELPLVVIKIGGSLFTSPNLIEQVEWLLGERADSRPLIICGGGAAADTVRRWQMLHGISDEQAHWLCLSAMSLNTRLLLSALPGSVPVEDWTEMDEAWEQDQRPILQCLPFLSDREPIDMDPTDSYWDITSDAIAAWCAQLAGADELILAKSVDLPDGETVESAASAGLVDDYFGRVCDGTPVTWTNLRATDPVMTDWL